MAKIYNYKDIDLTMSKKQDGDINEFISIDAVKSSIKNIIETLKGRRRMLPEFAGNLWNYLFEPMDEITAQSIGEYLIETIERWDSRVILDNIHITPNYSMHRYDIQVNFRIKNSEQVGELETSILQRI